MSGMTDSVPGLSPRCYALVPAAGAGVRSGAEGPKQYVQLAGRAMLAHTLDALLQVPGLSATLVVLAPDDDQFETALPDLQGRAVWVARCGGATRAQSVAKGLDQLLASGAQPQDWVLVHDAARCLLRPEWVTNLIEACLDDPVGGLLACPLPDTLKASQDGRVSATIDRQHKWAAQTPQMFRLGQLQAALAQAVSDGIAVTDEASAIEAQGHQPLLVEASLENFKVTWPADFALAERLLQSR
jgi:2-C-methyl-D-erythritol 4-phosphate cytidylyltransferase